MSRIYKLSRTGLKLLYKIRHHKGHGIHSPFVFNLITKVIEEKDPYYRYDDIKCHIDRCHTVRGRVSKFNKLSFRLVNYFGARNILEMGTSTGINTLFLTAPSRNIKCMTIESDIRRYNMAKQLFRNWEGDITLLYEDVLPYDRGTFDCICVDLNKISKFPEDINDYLAGVTHDKSFIIIKGIRTNRRCKALWKSIEAMDERTALLDLFSCGIVFFDKSLYRWKYQISF